MNRAIAVVVAVGCSGRGERTVPHPSQLPPPTPLARVPMAGPFPTMVDACNAAPVCGDTADAQSGERVTSHEHPDCSAVASARDPDGDGGGDTLVFHDRAGDVRIAAMPCAHFLGAPWVDAPYHAFVHRADGWWRSDALVAAVFNDRRCTNQESATWELVATHLVARLHGLDRCVACGKQGQGATDTAWLIVIDRAADRPVVYKPLLLGHGYEYVPASYQDPSSPSCAAEKWQEALGVRWFSPDSFEVSGPAHWRPLPNDEGNLGAGGKLATPNGRYRLAR